MDCVTLGLGSVVPVVSSFLLIASLLTQGHDAAPALGAPSIFLVALYPLVLTVVMIAAVLTGWGRRFEGPNGEELRSPLPGGAELTAAATSVAEAESDRV
jgi:hypothetical protein